ncbi:beta-glucosidase 22-like isoform X2 [Daucus carota subsp. sativus]|uniref:beta-glucosidase 22-like isoform X2 n=1 Tax=Daucus carota subsp. sativus TaxID=79200 RepID=UPI0030837F92
MGTSFVIIFMLMTVLVVAEMKADEVEGVRSFSRLDFPLPPHFVFGSSTSSYQVEGAAFEDGRKPSIWDTYAHSGYTNGANGDIACDEYHKYKEDVHLMVETGLEAYRFSISWSRLIPRIEPHVTLFHYDTPQILEDEYGGWLSKKTVKAFVAYANICFREFGDRVLHWTTFNEPNVFAHYGYDLGLFQPSRCSSPFGTNCVGGNSSTEPYIVAHNILLAHAATARLYFKKYKAEQHGLIGLDVYAYWYVPYTNAPEDVIATQRAFDFFIGWFLNPLVHGDYPDVMKKNAETRIPTFTKLESRLVKGSFDFLGLNHYSTIQVEDMSINLQMDVRDFTEDMAVNLICMLIIQKFSHWVPLPIANFNVYRVEPCNYINCTWLVNDTDVPQGQLPYNPSGLRELLEYMKNYGNPPIYIYENGQSTIRNETLHDVPRLRYIQGYIGSLLDALRSGSNARGYFIWSFLDVFELLDGFESGYGLYYVDLDDKNLKRYPKLSAQWYSNFLKGRSHQDM